jgi:hypothetical protein
MVDDNGPDLMGVGGWGLRSGRALAGGTRAAPLYNGSSFISINLWLSMINRRL